MRWLPVVCVVVLVGCRPPEPNPAVNSSQPAANDTLRGTLVLEGSDPFPTAVMRTSSGRVVLNGASQAMLKLSQLDLWLRGTRTSPTRFEVADYRVRGADGAKAWDGILRGGPSGFSLELDDGSSRGVRGAPSSFARLTGSRVWITEGADGTVSRYGVF